MKCELGQHQRDGSEHLKDWAGVDFGVLWKSPDPSGLGRLPFVLRLLQPMQTSMRERMRLWLS